MFQVTSLFTADSFINPYSSQSGTVLVSFRFHLEKHWKTSNLPKKNIFKMFKIFVRTVRIYIYSAEFFDVMAAVEVLPAPVQKKNLQLCITNFSLISVLRLFWACFAWWMNPSVICPFFYKKATFGFGLTPLALCTPDAVFVARSSRNSPGRKTPIV